MAGGYGTAGSTELSTTATSQEYDNEEFLSDYESEEAEERQRQAIMDYCRAVGECQEFNASSVPACERLSIRRKTGIQLVKDTVRKPVGAVPETRLPGWNRLSMDKKIPLYPAANRSIIFTRGSVGEDLHRKQKQFVNDDPYNQERVLAGSYNALHDPYAQNYFAKPSVKRQLIRQGLVTPTGQVICTLTEFNQFRSYLNSTVYNEEVNTSLDKYNLQVKVCMEQTRKIQKEESTTVGKDFKKQQKAELARTRTQRIAYENLQRFKERERIKEERMMRWKLLEEQKRLDRKMRAAEREQARLMILENLQQREYASRIQKMQTIEAKEKAALYRQYNECGMANVRREKQNLHWVEMKCDFQEEQEVKEELMELCLRQDILRKAEKRQRRIERHRANLPHILEEKRLRAQGVMKMVKKYFDKWVQITHSRRHSHPDTLHESLFPVTGKMEKTVDELMDESGLEINRKPDKFGDVVMAAVRAMREGKLSEFEDEHEDQDRGDHDDGKGDSAPVVEAPETPETDEAMDESEEPPAPEPTTPKPDADKKESRRRKKGDMEELMDNLVDNAAEQYAQDLVEGTLDHLFGEARARCQDLLREAHLCGYASKKKKMEGKLSAGYSPSISSAAVTDSVDTLFVRSKNNSAATTVEAWMQKNRNLSRAGTAGYDLHKHPDESVSLAAVHPKHWGRPRSICQGQGEHAAMDQFYHRGLERVDTSYSADSFLSPVSSARQTPDTGRSQRSKSFGSIHMSSSARPKSRRRPGTAESELSRGKTVSEPVEVEIRRSRGSLQAEDEAVVPTRRPRTADQLESAGELEIEKSKKRSRPATAERPATGRRGTSSRPESAGSDGSTDSSASLTLADQSTSVEAIREEYLMHRSRLNRSCSPHFDYSSDEFLNFQTDEEQQGNDVLYQIAQEARALSRTESLTSLSSFPMASEIAQSIHSAGQGKDDMECVMTKRNMFGSMESYHNFTDVVYQEMTLIAQNKTLLEELMDTLSTEEDMTLFRNDFFKKLLSTCVNDNDIRLVWSLYKGKRIRAASHPGQASKLPFNKAQSALALGSKFPTKSIKETKSGPSMLVARKLGFSPRKFVRKSFLGTERSDDGKKTDREDRLMKGDTMELIEADQDDSPRKEKLQTHSDTKSPRKPKHSKICEPNLKTTESEDMAAHESLSDHSNTSEKSYVTLSPSSSMEDRPVEPPPEFRGLPKLDLRKLNNVRLRKTPLKAYQIDAAMAETNNDYFQHKMPGPRLTSAAYSKLGSRAVAAPSTSTSAFVVQVIKKPRQTAPLVRKPMSRYTQPRAMTAIESPANDASRPLSRGKHRGLHERSSVPKLPALSPDRRPSPPEPVNSPRSRQREPEQFVTLVKTTKSRNFTKRRGQTERSIPPRRLQPVYNTARPSKSKPLTSSRFIANPNLGVVPSIMLRAALAENDVLYIPQMETIDEILKLVRTIVVYKITQQILMVVSSARIKPTHFSERMLFNIQKVAIKSIVKVSLPLAEMTEQRSFPQPQFAEMTLSSYRNRLGQLADGISSLIIAGIGNNTEKTVEV